MPTLLISNPSIGNIRLAAGSNPTFKLTLEATTDFSSWVPWKTYSPFLPPAEWDETTSIQGRRFYRLRRDW